jgi:methyltransferase-like protein
MIEVIMVCFPHIEITDNTSNAIFAGTYQEASVYGLSLNTIQFTDNITYYHNNHKFTIGTSSEINAIEYRFLTAFNGRWQYSSVVIFWLTDQIEFVGCTILRIMILNTIKTPSADYSVLLSTFSG